MPNPFDLIGSIVNQVLNALWTIITTVLQGATQVMLSGTITLLMASPWPNIGSPWFKTVWNNAFGLVILASFTMLVVHAAMAMLSSKDTSLPQAVIGTLKNFATGGFMLVAVLGGMVLSSTLMSIIALLVQSSVGTPNWGDLLRQDHNYTSADALAQFLALSVTTNNSTWLYIQATLSGGALMMYLVYYLLAGTFGFGLLGRIIRSMLLSLIFTQIFARVIQVGLLGIGAVVLHQGAEIGFSPVGFAWTSALATSAALWVPLIMFVVLAIRFYKHERALDPKVIAKQLFSQRTQEFSTQQLNSRRVEVMTKVRDGVVDAGREAIRTTAVAATAAGITKLTAAVLAKIPMPQAKVAALAVTGIHAGIKHASRKAEQKATQVINDRVARIGRSPR